MSDEYLLARLDRIADALERLAKVDEERNALARDAFALQKRQIEKADELQRMADESFKKAMAAMAKPAPDPETDDPLLHEILDQQAEIENDENRDEDKK